jgi:hypothetical protein
MKQLLLLSLLFAVLSVSACSSDKPAASDAQQEISFQMIVELYQRTDNGSEWVRFVQPGTGASVIVPRSSVPDSVISAYGPAYDRMIREEDALIAPTSRRTELAQARADFKYDFDKYRLVERRVLSQ